MQFLIIVLCYKNVAFFPNEKGKVTKSHEKNFTGTLEEIRYACSKKFEMKRTEIKVRCICLVFTQIINKFLWSQQTLLFKCKKYRSFCSKLFSTPTQITDDFYTKISISVNTTSEI